VTGPGGRPPREAPASDAHLAVPRESSGRLALEPLLHALRVRHGVRRLLVEGGALLHGALLDQRLADAIVRYEAPILLGGARAACAGAGATDPGHAPRLILEERRDLGPDLRRAFLLSP
jgi:riboflavin biosynthesis pyrimidine reductase